MFFAIYFSLCLVAFFPSFELVNESWSKPPLKIDEPISLGHTLLLDSDIFLYPPQIDGLSFSFIKNKKKWLGVVGIKKSSSVLISGVIEKNDSYFFPTVKMYKQNIPIRETDLNSANQLRLPTATWQKQLDADEELKSIQRARMYQAMDSISGEISTQCFKAPLSSKVVSNFSSPRRLPNGYAYRHTGVDLRAQTGTEIFSMGSGKVVLAEDQIVPGKVIVIDHGGGIYSRYFHLNEFKAKVGDNVEMNQQIGFSGSTGRVEAPHLHWEILWKGNHANPHQFLQAWEQICDQS